MKDPLLSELYAQLRGYQTSEWVSDPTTLKHLLRKDPPSPTQALAHLEQECAQCQACALAPQTNPAAHRLVFSNHAQLPCPLMIVGEAPGADEDRLGEPFVGRSGSLLVSTLEYLGQARSQVYITNIVKHRPPENRTPSESERQACFPFLLQQIRLIQPKLIITCGNVATQTLLDTKAGITKLRGQLQHSFEVPIFPVLHPSAILRNRSQEAEFKEDLHQALQILATLS